MRTIKFLAIYLLLVLVPMLLILFIAPGNIEFGNKVKLLYFMGFVTFFLMIIITFYFEIYIKRLKEKTSPTIKAIMDATSEYGKFLMSAIVGALIFIIAIKKYEDPVYSISLVIFAIVLTYASYLKSNYKKHLEKYDTDNH